MANKLRCRLGKHKWKTRGRGDARAGGSSRTWGRRTRLGSNSTAAPGQYLQRARTPEVGRDAVLRGAVAGVPWATRKEQAAKRRTRRELQQGHA